MFLIFIYLAAPGFNCSMQGPFSCSIWDLVLWPGIEPQPPALGGQSLSRWTTRGVHSSMNFTGPDLGSLDAHVCSRADPLSRLSLPPTRPPGIPMKLTLASHVGRRRLGRAATLLPVHRGTPNPGNSGQFIFHISETPRNICIKLCSLVQRWTYESSNSASIQPGREMPASSPGGYPQSLRLFCLDRPIWPGGDSLLLGEKQKQPLSPPTVSSMNSWAHLVSTEERLLKCWTNLAMLG